MEEPPLADMRSSFAALTAEPQRAPSLTRPACERSLRRHL
jgi:hypothetical protein